MMDGTTAGSTAERIAQVARALLVAEGSRAVSMRRVAALTAITPMAIYRHFANREALLEHVADGEFARIAAQWSGKPRRTDPRTRLLDQAGDLVDLALAEPVLYDFLFLERHERARQFPADFLAGRSPTLNLVVEGLEEGVQQGLFAVDDVWEAALVGAATLQGLIQLFRGGRIGLSEGDFRALCIRSVERYLDGLRD